ncbi:MAG: hypothetical protein G01um101466_106 [Parcubacteria group bacterium Gr01-1014_66]|nr:MAG: hypothetical protein G01um101466_106 [Parcubacteria group bacterium Gr01-1014_66]
MRLFIQNGEALFALSDIVSRTQVSRESTHRELSKLLQVGLIKKKQVATDSKQGKRTATKKQERYILNPQFPVLEELRNLITRATTTSRKSILVHLKKIGKVKLAVLSGIFLSSERSRTDLLIIGDDLNKKRLDRFLGYIESELGKTITYTLMDTDEFKYRMQMFDRFLRDILEYPHEKLINKLTT